LLSFLLFQWGECTALVIAKAALMALMGWVFIRVGRTPESGESKRDGWIAAGFAVFALLIVGSWMPLRPICVSCLFLALTLWLLERGLREEHPISVINWWPVSLLFAVWANLDAWFILGPLTLGLYFLGALLSGPKRIDQARTLGLVLLVGLAARARSIRRLAPRHPPACVSSSGG
jgi:hypothetical protein